MLEFFKIRFTTLSVALLSLCVAILACIVFYLSTPHLYLKKFVSNPIEISKRIIDTTSTDVAIIWDLDLDLNVRKPLGFSTRGNQDTKLVTDYLNAVKDAKITTALGPYELYSILAGQHICATTPAMSTKISATAKQFFEAHVNSFICLIPIEDTRGAIVGQINIIWREKPSQDTVTATIAQIKGILRNQ